MPVKWVWCWALVGVSLAVSGGAGRPHPRVKRASSVPADWRNLIDRDVLEYSQDRVYRAGGRLGGDIAGVDIEGFLEAANSSDPAVLFRNNVREREQLWPRGIVPFTIAPDEFTEAEMRVIGSAMRDMASRTCLTFPPRRDEKAFITFTKSLDGCYSYVGRIRRQQKINLQPDCINHLGEVQHEIMHALGFQHEQSRMDRDEYVRVIWENIPQDLHIQFAKYRGETQNLPYDYRSIMHYAYNQFSLDPANRPTLLPNRGRAPIGNRKEMSVLDVRRVNRLYACPAAAPPRAKSPTRRRGTTSFLLPAAELAASEADSPPLTQTAPPLQRPGTGKANGSPTVGQCPAGPNGLRVDNCQSEEECLESGRGRICCTFCAGSRCSNYCAR